MKQRSLEVTKFEVDISISSFGDWRDWFLSKEDKVQSVHKTAMQFYIDEYLIAQKMIPINFEEIMFHIEFLLKQDMLLDELFFEIPEMNIHRTTLFKKNVTTGDTVKFDYRFKIEK